jgi:hypothetical protein
MPLFDFPTAIDSTMNASFSACPTKFRNSFGLKKAAHSDSIHLVFGGAYARGLEVMRRAHYEQGRSLIEAKTLGEQAILNFWLTSQMPAEPEGQTKTLPRCITAFDSYMNHFNPASDFIHPMRLAPNDPTCAIEFTFALPIPGIYHPQTGEPLLYSGRFDMLAEAAPGVLYIVDDKTAGQLGKSLSNSMRLKSQFTGYSWACREYGYNVNGVIIRATQALKTKTEHAELIEQRPNFMIDRWLEQLQLNASKMIQSWQLDFWEHSYDEACGSYGGCEFQDACASVDELAVLEMFKDRDWDPLHTTGAVTETP